MARVLLTTMQVKSIQDDVLRPLIEDGHELVLLPAAEAANEERLIAALRDTPAVIAGTERYTARVFDASSSLKIVARTGVGYDAIDVDAAIAHSVLVTTTPGANHHSVAEAAVGLIVAALRRFAFADRQMRTTGWNPRPYGIELRGKTVGVVGTGLIGKEVVRRLQGWDVSILLSDVVQDQGFAERYGAQYVDRDALFREADVVTLHAPLLPATRHLVNATTLRAMKSTAFLVNTARGPLVDEAALAQALREGWIAGAALDVFETEPLPAESPLLELPNVTLSQHIAGVTAESMQAMTAMAVDSVRVVLRGGRPATIVNP
ncbi:MAG: phosphoglycerate dehydrogenase [Chloroflexi bacterium]|nr:phosphoglycerate dehydrogenase [Chloroflexota bacterium]